MRGASLGKTQSSPAHTRVFGHRFDTNLRARPDFLSSRREFRLLMQATFRAHFPRPPLPAAVVGLVTSSACKKHMFGHFLGRTRGTLPVSPWEPPRRCRGSSSSCAHIRVWCRSTYSSACASSAAALGDAPKFASSSLSSSSFSHQYERPTSARLKHASWSRRPQGLLGPRRRRRRRGGSLLLFLPQRQARRGDPAQPHKSNPPRSA